MAAARQQFQAGAHLLVVFRLGQDAPAAGHHRVGGQDESRCMIVRATARAFSAARRRAWSARQFALADAFVDGGGNDGVGHDAGLGQQRQAPRAFAGQNQRRS